MANVTQNSVFVTWNIPICPNANLAPFKFLVTVTEAAGSSAFERQVHREIAGLAVPSLDPETTYAMSLVGINCFGKTEPAELTIETLAEGGGVIEAVICFFHISLL